MGGPREAVDESDEVERVREEEPEELGGDMGMLLSGTVRPSARGI